MKFGVREICDVVLKAKSNIKIGTQEFVKDEPVIYLDSAKTSSIDGESTSVYAQGGKGNSRLIAWEGERTVTFTFEDALLSPLGFAILSGAGLIDASDSAPLTVHSTAKVEGKVAGTTGSLTVSADLTSALGDKKLAHTAPIFAFLLDEHGTPKEKLAIDAQGSLTASSKTINLKASPTTTLKTGDSVMILIDYYQVVTGKAVQLEITADKFAGYYYLEASTLFRRQDNGDDMAAEFVIPNAKIQSSFNFAMASSGDPTTFTFTMDAFPGYTHFDKSKQVLFALQIVE